MLRKTHAPQENFWSVPVFVVVLANATPAVTGVFSAISVGIAVDVMSVGATSSAGVMIAGLLAETELAGGAAASQALLGVTRKPSLS